MSKQWSWGLAGPILKKWTVDFYPMKEPVSMMRFWDILSGLPLDFWTRYALKEIGKKLGVFIGLEPNWASKNDRRWDWIQIEVDVRGGLIGSIDNIRKQRVGYWHLSFRCHNFHEIGYIRNQCPCLMPSSMGPHKVWRRNSNIGHANMIEEVSVEGRHEEVQLGPDTIFPTSQALDDLVKQATKGMDNSILVSEPMSMYGSDNNIPCEKGVKEVNENSTPFPPPQPTRPEEVDFLLVGPSSVPSTLPSALEPYKDSGPYNVALPIRTLRLLPSHLHPLP
jgi:hypothetical protein